MNKLARWRYVFPGFLLFLSSSAIVLVSNHEGSKVILFYIIATHDKIGLFVLFVWHVFNFKLCLLCSQFLIQANRYYRKTPHKNVMLFICSRLCNLKQLPQLNDEWFSYVWVLLEFIQLFHRPVSDVLFRLIEAHKVVLVHTNKTRIYINAYKTFNFLLLSHHYSVRSMFHLLDKGFVDSDLSLVLFW